MHLTAKQLLWNNVICIYAKIIFTVMCDWIQFLWAYYKKKHKPKFKKRQQNNTRSSHDATTKETYQQNWEYFCVKVCL